MGTDGGAAMSRWGRVFAACAGLVMVAGGFLVLSGSSWGYLLVAGAAVILVVSPLARKKRPG